MGLRVTCKQCGGSHPAFDCKKSTAARKDVQKNPDPGSSIPTAQDQGLVNGAAGTQALPVDTNSEVNDMVGSKVAPVRDTATTSAGTVGNKDRQPIPKRGRGRPKTITDMKVYKAMKQREYRARKK